MNHDAHPISNAKRFGELGPVHGDGLDPNEVIPAADAPHRLDPPLAGSRAELRLRIELDSFQAVADLSRVSLRPLSKNAPEASLRHDGQGRVPASRDALFDWRTAAPTA